jgi:hypothetical protein
MRQNGPSNAEAAENSDSSFAAATQSGSHGRLTPHHGDEETDSQHLRGSSARYESGVHLFLHSSYTSGQRIRFEYKGRAAAGTVDTATDDDSVVWVWLDGGGGRVMLFPGPETVITADIPAAVKGEPGALNGAAPCWCHAASGIFESLA